MDATDTVRFTRHDYAQLPEGFPAYLLDGDFVREAAPTRWHQSIAQCIGCRLEAVAPGRVLQSPVDVVIDDFNVLQPDVLAFAEGYRPTPAADPEVVPALVVEVLSPVTAGLDRTRKTAYYLRAGVAEVWLVDPGAGTIDVVTPAARRHHAADHVAESVAVPGFRLSWAEIARERGA